MITTVETKKQRYEIYLDEKFVGWMFIPKDIEKYCFIPFYPVCLSGEAYKLIGRELNQMNADIEVQKLAEVESLVRLLK